MNKEERENKKAEALERQKQSIKRQRHLLLASWIGTGVIALLAATLICARWPEIHTMELNQWGDFIAGFSAFLAFLWLICGFYLQREELRQNTEALNLQHEELGYQVEEMRAQNKATLVIAEAAKIDAETNRKIFELTQAQDINERKTEKIKAAPRFLVEGPRTSSGGGMAGGIIYLTNAGGKVKDFELRAEGGEVQITSNNKEVLDSMEKTTVKYKTNNIDKHSQINISCVDMLGNKHVFILGFKAGERATMQKF